MTNLTRALSVFVLGAALGACAPANQTADPLASLPSAGTINGQSVPQAALNAFLNARFRKPPAELTEQELAQGRDDFSQLVVLAQKAREQGLNADPEIAGQLMIQEMNALAQTLLSKRMEANEIDDAKVQAAYEAKLNTGEAREYKARHILVETEEAAKAVITKLDEGADFAELAKTDSTGPSGPQGGDLGWFGEGRMVEPFFQATVALESGNYTAAPVQTQFGWHVILLEQTRDRPFAESSAQLKAQMQREVIESYVNELKDAATISWNP